MGTRTLLQLVNTARSELGLFPTSASIASSSDAINQQMMALINQLGDELQEQHSWTAQQTENVITTEVAVSTTGNLTEGSAVITNIPDTSALEATTWVVTGMGLVPSARIVSVDSATQITMSEEATDTQAGVALLFAKDTYAIPVDFQSYVSTTWWDRSNRWELLGPTSPQMDQALRSGIVTTSPRRNWRQVGRLPGAWRIWPPPGANDPALTMVYEYNSIYWATDYIGTPWPRMEQDLDTNIFPDRVMINGLKAKFFDAKGMDTTKLTADYRKSIAIAMAQDGGAGNLSLSGRRNANFLLNYWNIPDNGYGPS